MEDIPKSKKVSIFNGLGKLFDPNCAKLMRPDSWNKSVNPATYCSATGTYKQTAQWDVVVPNYFATDATPARIRYSGN